VTVKNLLQTLAENNRLGHLQGVCEKFGELMSAKRGEIEMTSQAPSVWIIKLFRDLRLLFPSPPMSARGPGREA
jgi:hypothetical protein